MMSRTSGGYSVPRRTCRKNRRYGTWKLRWTGSRFQTSRSSMLKRLCQKMFGRSLWVYHANSGGCNGCDIEVLNALTPYYDAERFGIKLVASPRHADVMLWQGPAMRAAE